MLDFGGAAALHRHERTPQRDLQHDLPLSSLGSLRLGPEQIERARQVAHRLARGAPLRSDLAGGLQVTDRPARIAPALEVHGQLGRHLDGALAQPGLEPRADATVQIRPAGGGMRS